MLGTILGLVSAFYYITLAFTGQINPIWGIYIYLIPALLIGILLMPRTIGISFFYLIIASPIAAIGGGIINNSWNLFFISLGLMVVLFILNAILVRIRDSSFPRRY